MIDVHARQKPWHQERMKIITPLLHIFPTLAKGGQGGFEKFGEK